MRLLVSRHLTDQLINIFDAVRRILLIGLLQLLHISGRLQYIFYQF